MDLRFKVRLAAVLVLALPISAEKPSHLYLCRSPLLAFNFWEALGNLKRQGITVTPKIAQRSATACEVAKTPNAYASTATTSSR